VEQSQLLRSRALELYFNYPVIGNLWRGLKRQLSRN
jgi:hypothetical protein